MPKRATVPEGKSLFFRPSEAVVEAHIAEIEEDKGTTRQSAIFLEEKHLDWLDDRCKEARRNGGKAIRKAVIIRALLDVAIESPVDLSGLRDTEDIAARLKRAIRSA
jgi:hypothetical protein